MHRMNGLKPLMNGLKPIPIHNNVSNIKRFVFRMNGLKPIPIHK